MTPKKEIPQQLPLLEAQTSWFHIFRAMIESGDAAKMGGTTFLIYSVVKAHTNWSTGRSFPSIETIMEKAGASKRTVLGSLKTLEEMGYITREKRGRKNAYTLREKVQIEDEQGRPTAVAMWDYLPSTVKAAQAELKNFVMTGEATDFKIIHVETLNLNVQIGDYNTQLNVGDLKDPTVRKMAERIEEARRRSKESGE